MADKDPAAPPGGAVFQKLGLGVAALFFAVSVSYVHFAGKNRAAIDPDVRVITLAHWQLEDGYREGMDAVIRRFEAMKAERGEAVRVIQTTVPWRGYMQWLTTQLIGGNPADVIEQRGKSQLLQQYFVPLSPYIGRENPFNKGTPLEGLAWKDTITDGMEGSFDSIYAEYFGIGTYTHVHRLFVNLDLLERATGARKLPEDLVSWMEMCERIKRYGERTGQSIVPIGVRGFDGGNVQFLFEHYFSQLNGHLNDDFSRYTSGKVERADILRCLLNGTITKRRLLAVVDIMAEIGRYFAEGFTALDLEQTKFLFYSGSVAFFPEGTWNGYSLMKNSPFPVGVADIPPVGRRHRYSEYFTGGITELGKKVSGKFGIPKASKNFDLALEFLQFLTSYEMNQLAASYSKWPAVVKGARMDGVVAYFQPVAEGNRVVEHPFTWDWRANATRKLIDTLNTIIVTGRENPTAYFWDRFLQYRDAVYKEVEESLTNDYRSDWDKEFQRTQYALAGKIQAGMTPDRKNRLRMRLRMHHENAADVKGRMPKMDMLDMLRRLEED